MATGFPTVFVPKKLGWMDYFRSLLANGRIPGMTAGSYLSDLTAPEIRRPVMLCKTCSPKFREIMKRVGYVESPYEAFGMFEDCHDCRKEHSELVMFHAEELFSQTRLGTPRTQRGFWSLPAMSRGR